VSSRPLDRLASIRAKLGLVIVFAVGMTVVLVYLLLGYALRNTSEDKERLLLLQTAKRAASGTLHARPDDVSVQFLDVGGERSTGFRSTMSLPRFRDGQVHQGSANGFDYAAVPVLRDRRYVGTVYAIRRSPADSLVGRIAATFGFLKSLWWQLLAGGALAAGIALLLARLLALGMTRPLREMARASARMAHGEYGQRVQTTSRDEVGELAAAFNRMSAELAQVEHLRRELVANVSHELKTPISALRAHLENLLDGVERPDRSTLQVMLGQSERLSRLVDQLLDLSRLESGDVPFERDEVDVADLVHQVVSELRVGTHGRVALEEELPSDLPPAWADRERLHQVVFNLLDNAVRFTPSGGTVTVSASANRERIRLDVRDTGPGIPPEHLPHVFERFYRVEQARSRGDGGTGIGLAIARSIIESHGGRIWAESEVGRGSTFSFEVPASSAAVASTSDRDLSPRSRDRIVTTTGGSQ
jgi:signal transduction histidine kinase